MKVEFCLRVIFGKTEFKVFRTMDVSFPILEDTRLNFFWEDLEPDFPCTEALVKNVVYHPPTDTVLVGLQQVPCGLGAEGSSTAQIGDNAFVAPTTKTSFVSYLCALLRDGWTLYRHEFNEEEDAREYLRMHLGSFPGGKQSIVHFPRKASFAVIPTVGLRGLDAMKTQYRVVETVDGK